MQLSAPVYRLKRQARLLARQKGIALHAALDQLAAQEGFQNWSHLAATNARTGPAVQILPRLNPGDMILIGARPGEGKTLLGLELAARAQTIERTGFFFTLEYNERDVADRFSDLGLDPAGTVIVDTSDDISAQYIINRLDRFSGPVLVVIDYLQLLDQKRSNQELDQQIAALAEYVRTKQVICAVISQIDRRFDHSGKATPDLSDIRLPNPLDLSRFDAVCFLNDGTIRIRAAA